jgi:hypothetical protein
MLKSGVMRYEKDRLNSASMAAFEMRFRDGPPDEKRSRRNAEKSPT